MASFSYEALDVTGKRVTGVLEADFRKAAEDSLLTGGFIPLKIKEQKDGGNASWFQLSFGGNSLKIDEVILFTKQFRSMYHAGIPVLRVLQVLREQAENATVRKVAAAMEADVSAGATLYDAMRRHPRVFSRLYCGLIRAAEMSGNVPEVMERLTYILSHEAKVKSDIKAAMQYPLIVSVTLSIAFVFLLTFVIPKFITIFEKANLKLPLPTLMAIGMYHFLTNYWYLIIGGIAGTITSVTLYVRTEKGRFVKDTLLLQVPIFGKLFIKASMSRFASIFGILHASGVPVLSALAILSEVFGNAALSKVFKTASTQVEEGRGIAVPLSEAGYFPPMVIAMVAIGEESGNLDSMLKEISDYYDDEVKHSIAKMSEMIGPVMTVALAVVVGFFALAIFMPMWDLTKMTKPH
jgi:type IV pilus assembly protein PilC